MSFADNLIEALDEQTEPQALANPDRFELLGGRPFRIWQGTTPFSVEEIGGERRFWNSLWERGLRDGDLMLIMTRWGGEAEDIQAAGYMVVQSQCRRHDGLNIEMKQVF